MKRGIEPDAAVSAHPLVLTGEGMAWLGVAAILAGVGWYKSINLVLLLAYLMFVLLVLNGFLAARQARRVEARREPSAPCHAGESVMVRVSVANAGVMPASVVVTDRLAPEPVTWFVHRLAPGQSVVCSARQVLPTRGRFVARPVRVSSSAPLGLLSYDKSGATPGEVVVLPALGTLDADGLRRWLVQQADGTGRARLSLHRATADPADVRGIRPYREGDPIRTIHWRSTARRRQLMVREYDTTPSPDLVLVVEPWLPLTPTLEDRTGVEAALSLAATVARAWALSSGATVCVAVAGDPESYRTAGTTEEAIRTALIPLAGVIGAAGFTPLPPTTFRRGLRRATRVVVSSRRCTPYAAELTHATGSRFVAISPADPLPWYLPPQGLVA